MPLTKIQSEVLRLLAAHRDPESYVAGSTPLNREAARFSSDIDIFHDREERVARAAQEDGRVLEQHGYRLQWTRREPSIYAVVAEREGASTKLEWVVDSDFRFFPAVRDERFGYVLHPVDLATNKVAAATMIRLREVLHEAEAFLARMPTDKVGLLFLRDGKVVQPDPDRLQDYQTHAGQRRGHWPGNSEITSAMLES